MKLTQLWFSHNSPGLSNIQSPRGTVTLRLVENLHQYRATRYKTCHRHCTTISIITHCVWCTSACHASKSATNCNISTISKIYRICGTTQCHISGSRWCRKCNETSNTGDQLCTFIGCHTTHSSNLLPNSTATTATAADASAMKL